MMRLSPPSFASAAVLLFVGISGCTIDEYNWQSYGGHLYALTRNHGTWLECEVEAQAAGGHLVTINDAAENSWLSTTFQGYYRQGGRENHNYSLVWIGLEWDANEWRWSSGEPVTFPPPWYNNAAGRPHGGVHTYLHTDTHHQPGTWWEDTAYDGENPAWHVRGIIERQPQPESATRSLVTGKPDIQVAASLVLVLADGSRIIGEPEICSISLHAAFGKIEIPLKHVRLVRFHEDHKTILVHLRNGDRLTGVLDSGGSLRLKTLMGQVSVDVGHIKAAKVLRRTSLSAKLKEALVLYYPFDKAEQEVKDQSGKGNHGRNQGAKYSPKGVVNGAFQFDGNAGVICKDDPSLDLADAMTIALWVKLGPPVADYAAQIVHKAPPRPTRGGAMILLYYFGTAASTSMGHIRPYATLGGQWERVKGFRAKEHVWYHLAIVYNGDDMRFYKDGEQLGVRHRGGLATNNEPLLIGKGWGLRHGHGIIGTIDELMIFNRALSAEQIRQLYDAQKSDLTAIPG